MEVCKRDGVLIIKSSENNLEMKNGYRMKADDNESSPICKLNNFFSNNIDVELGKISILQLSNCDLNEIPSTLQKLNLKQLILAHNKLKEVSSCLYSSLSDLELLDLSHNYIENFDIEPACSCTIVTLKLNNNQIQNLPHWILTLRCPKLTELVYSFNYLKNLKSSHQIHIKKLEMQNCTVMDMDFPFFKSIKSLECLDISNNNLCLGNENVFKNIDNLFAKATWKNLQILNLSNITISIIPQDLFWITSLTELYLENCALSWIQSDIQYLINLTILDVSSNSISFLPEELAILQNLTTLKAPSNEISSIPEFTHDIHILDLYDNLLEMYPTCASRAKFIDLEKNCFETKNCDYYEEKRDKFREMFSYKRCNGFKEPLLPLSDAESHSKLSDSDCESIIANDLDDNYNSTETEDWDEEKPVRLVEKNPEVTSSDDEWDGKVETKRERNVGKRPEFDPHEEWIFSDVEEI